MSLLACHMLSLLKHFYQKNKTKHKASECYSASAEPSSCGQRDSLPFYYYYYYLKSGRPNSPEIKQIMGSIMLDLRVN